MNPPEGVTHWEGPGLDAWRPWSAAQVAERLAGVTAPWCVVGGCAIDLWLGRPTRIHEDIEIAVPRGHFAELRAQFVRKLHCSSPGELHAFQFYVVGDGEVRRLPDDAMPPADKHQNWVLDVAADSWRMDVMLEPGDARTWVFRRDERISELRARMVGTRDGIPFLQPQCVLLFKAKALRDKDEADFRACLPHLDRSARTWLADALAMVHADHPWIELLGRGGGAIRG